LCVAWTDESQVVFLGLIAIECCNLAEILLGIGEFAAAEALIEEALEQASRIGYRALIGGAQTTRALLLLNRDEIDAAAGQVLAAIEPTAAANDHETAPLLLSAAAVIAAARGEPLRAAMLWAAAERLFSQRALHEPAMVATLRSLWLAKAQAAVPDAHRWEENWTRGAELPVPQALIVAATVVAATEVAGEADARPVSTER
jgi:tetratricopeptide (TPR) repeat protein